MITLDLIYFRTGPAFGYQENGSVFGQGSARRPGVGVGGSSEFR